MGEAGSQKFANEMLSLSKLNTYPRWWRVAHAILVGFLMTSCHGALAQDFGNLDRPSWDRSDNRAEYELGGALFPDALKPNQGAGAPSGSVAANFYGPAPEKSGDVAARLFPSLTDPVGQATAGFQRIHGLNGSTGDLIAATDDLPSALSGVSNNSLGNPSGVPGLGNGPFTSVGNLFQGGNGNPMNTLLQGLAFFSMLQDLLGSFSSAGDQFNASNTGRSALMAASNLLGVLAGNGNMMFPGSGGPTLPFGGSNSFTNAALQRLGESTLGVPGTESGNLACAWVVNDIFQSITGRTIVGPNGNPLSVYDTVRAMEGNPQMFTEVTREQAISSGRDFVSAWNPAWGGSASHIVYGRGDQGIGNSSGSRSIGTQGIGGQHARYFVINQ